MPSINRRQFLRTASAGLVAGLGQRPENCFGVLQQPADTDSKPDLPPVPRRTLGQTGMNVSSIGLGSHINEENMNNPADRIRQIRTAYDMGINLFDIYEHTYHQFHNTSEALKSVRDKVYYSICWVPPGYNKYKGEITAQFTRQVMEDNLRLLQTDYVDLCRVVRGFKNEDQYITTLKMKEEGKIRALGLVAHFEKEFLEAFQKYDCFDYIMLPFNPVNNRAKFSKVFAHARKNKMGIIGIKPFAAGSLFKLKAQDLRQHDIEVKEKVSLPQALLKYILNTDGIVTTLPAMNSFAEMQENIGTLNDMSFGRNEKSLLRKYQKLTSAMGSDYLPPHYRWLHEEWTLA